jgi:hypothetical protein
VQRGRLAKRHTGKRQVRAAEYTGNRPLACRHNQTSPTYRQDEATYDRDELKKKKHTTELKLLCIYNTTAFWRIHAHTEKYEFRVQILNYLTC